MGSTLNALSTRNGASFTNELTVNSSAQRLAISTGEATPRWIRAQPSRSTIVVTSGSIGGSARWRPRWGFL